MKVRIINRPVGNNLIVSVEGDRVRIIFNESEPLPEDVVQDNFFRPGLLLSLKDSEKYLNGLAEVA